jgi:hypothetical protein
MFWKSTKTKEASMTCPHCNVVRIEIDRFGERLIGGVVCNLWTWPSSPSVTMALPDDDLTALRKRVGN